METRDWVNEDPVLYFLLGRRSGHLVVHAAVRVAFVLCLGVAALHAAGVLGIVPGLIAMAAVVIAVSWWVVPQVSLIIAALAFLFTNGFIYDLQGTLSWHGDSDIWTLLTLLLVAVAASIAGRWKAERSRAQVRTRNSSGPQGSRMFWEGV